MSILHWPLNLPQSPLVRFTGGLVNNRETFNARAGVPIERPITTDTPAIYEVTFQVLSLEEFNSFETWFRDDLKQGVENFVFRDPFTQVPHHFRFVGQNPPYAVAAASGGQFASIQAQLMRIPGGYFLADYIPDGTSRVPNFVADYENNLFSVFGLPSTSSIMPNVAGTHVVQRFTTTAITTERETLTQGDIPASAPAGTTKILGFLP